MLMPAFPEYPVLGIYLIVVALSVIKLKKDWQFFKYLLYLTSINFK